MIDLNLARNPVGRFSTRCTDSTSSSLRYRLLWRLCRRKHDRRRWLGKSRWRVVAGKSHASVEGCSEHCSLLDLLDCETYHCKVSFFNYLNESQKLHLNFILECSAHWSRTAETVATVTPAAQSFVMAFKSASWASAHRSAVMDRARLSTCGSKIRKSAAGSTRSFKSKQTCCIIKNRLLLSRDTTWLSKDIFCWQGW